MRASAGGPRRSAAASTLSNWTRPRTAMVSTSPERTAWLGLLARTRFDAHLAVLDQLGCQRARLDDTGEPQPLVEPLRAGRGALRLRVRVFVLAAFMGRSVPDSSVLAALLEGCLERAQRRKRRVGIEGGRRSRRGSLHVVGLAARSSRRLAALAAGVAATHGSLPIAVRRLASAPGPRPGRLRLGGPVRRGDAALLVLAVGLREAACPAPAARTRVPGAGDARSPPIARPWLRGRERRLPPSPRRWLRLVARAGCRMRACPRRRSRLSPLRSSGCARLEPRREVAECSPQQTARRAGAGDARPRSPVPSAHVPSSSAEQPRIDIMSGSRPKPPSPVAPFGGSARVGRIGRQVSSGRIRSASRSSMSTRTARGPQT